MHEFFRRRYEAFLKRLFLALFAKHIQGLKSQIETLDARQRLQTRLMSEHRSEMGIMRQAFQNMSLAAATCPKRNFIVLAYNQGNRDVVRFYDMKGTNLGALRSMIEGYRKAGMAVLVDDPLKPVPNPKGASK